MKSNRVLETIARYGVVPVIVVESVAQATGLADALMEGGLPLAEITFHPRRSLLK